MYKLSKAEGEARGEKGDQEANPYTVVANKIMHRST